MVIDYLRSLPNNNLSNKLLFYKTVMLLILLSGQRLSTLYHFRIDEIQNRDKETIFNETALLKQDKASRKKEPVILHAYPHDEHLCPVTLIRQYRLIRDALVPPTKKAFFVTHGKPHHVALKDTLVRWVKDTMSSSSSVVSAFALYARGPGIDSHHGRRFVLSII